MQRSRLLDDEWSMLNGYEILYLGDKTNPRGKAGFITIEVTAKHEFVLNELKDYTNNIILILFRDILYSYNG